MVRTLLTCAFLAAFAAACSSTPGTRHDTQTASAKTGIGSSCDANSMSQFTSPVPGCGSASGRSYSRSQIETTGQTDLADALGKLDPSITVHH